MTNEKANIIIEFPPNTISNKDFVRFTKMIRNIVIVNTGMEHITVGEYIEGGYGK